MNSNWARSVNWAWMATFAAGLALAALARSQEPAPAPALVDAKYDDEQMIWTLGDQVWEFGDLETTYLPAKGEFNPQTREVVWTLQLVRDLTAGEAGFQNTVAGSPFQPTFLDAEKITLLSDARVKITPISGRLGDAIRVMIRLPDETTLSKAALIRLERRTEIGF
jgi:hypothetical protein